MCSRSSRSSSRSPSSRRRGAWSPSSARRSSTSAETWFFVRWSKRRRSTVGVETLVGRTAVVVRALTPRGQVKVDGEVWEARSEYQLAPGEEVVVTGVDGLVLDVEPARRRATLQADARVRRHRLRGLGAPAGRAHGRGRPARGARRGLAGLERRSPSPGAPTPACTRPGRLRASTREAGRRSRALAEALNAALPDDVAVVTRRGAVDGFHARFSATGRSYRYVVLEPPSRARRSERGGRSGGRDRSTTMRSTRPPRCWSGAHDFTRVHADGDPARGLRARVRAAAWERRGDELHFTITADSFLRHMVRTLVGTMLERGPDDGRTAAPGRAPARGGRGDRAAVGPLPRARRTTTARQPG